MLKGEKLKPSLRLPPTTVAAREWPQKVWSDVGQPREECFGIIGRRRRRLRVPFQPLLSSMHSET